MLNRRNHIHSFIHHIIISLQNILCIEMKLTSAVYMIVGENTNKGKETIKIIIASCDWTDEADNIKKSGIPVCFVYGKEEELINYQYLNDFPSKWGGEIFLIENAGHFANAEQPERFNKLLSEFAGEVF